MASYGMDYQGGSGGGGGFNSGGGGGYGYGGGGGGGGGGNYQNSQRSGNTNSSSRIRKSQDEQTITPCTVRMLLNAVPEGGSYAGDATTGVGDIGNTIELQDGRKLHHIVLVGAVCEIIENSTNLLLEIEDGTGVISCKQWLEQNTTNECHAKYELRQNIIKNGENKYVTVIGTPKVYDGNIQILADSVRLTSTGNELTHHMLNVIYAGEKYKNQHKLGQPTSLMGNNYGIGFGNNPSNSTTNKPLQVRSMNNNTTSSAVSGITNSNTDNKVTMDVINMIRKEGMLNQDIGVNINKVFTNLRNQYNENDIRTAIGYLAANGDIYSTYDEDHYQASNL